MKNISPFLVFSAFCLFAIGCGNSNSESRDGPSTAKGETLEGSSNSRPFSGQSLGNWPKTFEEMTTVLNLSDLEQGVLKTTFEEHTKILRGWYDQHGKTYSSLHRKIMAAAQRRDLSKMKRLTAQAIPLRDEALRLHQAMDRAVLKSLSQDKRFQWEGHLLANRILKLAKSLDLTEQQVGRIRELGIKAAKNTKANVNNSAAGFIYLEQSVETEVLTELQQNAYAEEKNKNVFRSLEKTKTY